MKTIIFSDLHLSHHFNQRKSQVLIETIKKFDRVIINGDFIDRYFTNFRKLMFSPWLGLFDLLSQKESIYVLGNHDDPVFAHKILKKYFQKIEETYSFQSGNLKFCVEHGHRLAPTPDTICPLLFGNRPVMIIGTLFTDLATRFFPYFFQYANNKMKNWAGHNLKEKEFLVCSHSHLLEFNLKIFFINTGCSKFESLVYLEIDDSKLALKSKSY